MSIADKLLLIAEKEQAVYDTGHTRGHDSGYVAGYSKGQETGYETGHTEGEIAGIAQGRAEGIEIGKAEGYATGKAEGQEIGKAQGYSEGYMVGKAEGEAVSYDIGYADGHATGQAEGKAEGIVEGNNQFWDAFTNNGQRITYNGAFAYSGWEYIRPNRQLQPTSNNTANQTFYGCSNLKKLEAAYFDFSQKTKGTSAQHGFYYTFYHCTALEEIEDIGIQPQVAFTSMFNGCQKLHTVAKIRVDVDSTLTDIFAYCNALVNVTFEGEIGKSLNVRWAKKLSKDSIENIIGCLSDAVTGQSLTLSKTAVNTAFGINVDDDTTFPEGSEYYVLRHSKDNWNVLYQ